MEMTVSERNLFIDEKDIKSVMMENNTESEDNRASKEIFIDFIKNNEPVVVKSNGTEGWVDLIYKNFISISYPQQGSPYRQQIFNFSMWVIGQSLIRIFFDKESATEILEILDRKAFKLLLKGI